jgi:hypothetical protein
MEITQSEKKDNHHRQFEFLIFRDKKDMRMTSIITVAKLQLKSNLLMCT